MTATLETKFNEWYNLNAAELKEHFLIYQLNSLEDPDMARTSFFDDVFYTCPIDKSDKSFEGYIRKELIPKLSFERLM